MELAAGEDDTDDDDTAEEDEDTEEPQQHRLSASNHPATSSAEGWLAGAGHVLIVSTSLVPYESGLPYSSPITGT